MRQPYLIYKRCVRGKKSYYVKIWDEDKYDYSVRKSILSIKDELGTKGNRFPHTSKAGAEALVQIWLKNRPTKENSKRLDNYLSSFWEPSSDFLKSQEMRGKTYSLTYLKNNKSGIDNFFLPYLEEINKREVLLHQVNVSLLESFLTYMTEKNKVGTKRINDILQAVKVALSEAFRLGLISDNPGIRVKKLQTIKSERIIFTPEEVKRFFSLCSDPRQYGINLLAATTGMRQGECLGLLKQDIKEGYIRVCHNWQNSEGLKPPKWGSYRTVPLPRKTSECLNSLIKKNPYQNDFIFWGTTPENPLSKNVVAKVFRDIVENKMKIKDRGERGLTFHAWRHWYNSMLRGNVPDHALRQLTGHSSEAMTERYTEITEEQRRAVFELADKIM